MKILITGGCGFIGSHFLELLQELGHESINIDCLTFVSNLESYRGDNFYLANICNANMLEHVVTKHKPDAVVNFAAETHVDRSIINSRDFMQSNVVGASNVFNAARLAGIPVIHISTDEVYGATFTPVAEDAKLNPSSPYAASKASADLIALACFKTYGQDIRITRCTNNYGARQYPEKFIPLITTRASNNKAIPIYGTGLQMRDWLYVKDHCRAIYKVLMHGEAGNIYNISANNCPTNLDVAKHILKLIDKPESLIEHVANRLGHDECYTIDSTKIRALGWKPETSWQYGIEQTVLTYR